MIKPAAEQRLAAQLGLAHVALRVPATLVSVLNEKSNGGPLSGFGGLLLAGLAAPGAPVLLLAGCAAAAACRLGIVPLCLCLCRNCANYVQVVATCMSVESRARCQQGSGLHGGWAMVFVLEWQI